MKILLISDTESKALWDGKNPELIREADLILSCGDLEPEYLSYLVTMGTAPLYYVHGNHDDKYAIREPEGCESIEDKVVTFRGLRIAGLGGSRRYKEGVNQYSEAEMAKRAAKLKNKIRRAGGVDILLTHAAAAGLGDAEDMAHRGFETFLDFMDTYQPAYLIHGHLHRSYGRKFQRIQQYQNTTVINACGYYLLEIEEDV